MTTHSCTPVEMASTPSCATTEKNEFAPLNGFELGVDGNGETRRGRSSMHAYSSRPTMKPVASTEGISRNMSD